MGTAKLYSQSGKKGLDINGIIEDYYAYAGENISAGDFVEFVNGIAGSTSETSVDTPIIETTEYGRILSACKLTENKVFIAHGQGYDTSSASLGGIVCTINGATIIYGTDTTIVSGSYSGAKMSVVALSETSVFIAYNYANTYRLKAIVCTISDTTIAKGTEVTLVNSDKSSTMVYTTLLSNGNVFVAHSYGSSYYLYGIVCSVSGTTITNGTDTAIVSGQYAGFDMSTALLPNGNVFISHCLGTSYHLYGIVCTISGTTITKGTDTAIVSGQYAGFNTSTVTLPNGNVFITHSNSTSYHKYAIVCTVTGTTITIGTDTLLIPSTTAFQSANLLDDGSIFMVYGYDTSYYLYGMICMVTGTTISNGTNTQLDAEKSSAHCVDSVVLPSGSKNVIFVAHSSNKNYYLYAQIWGVDETNNIPTSNITVPEYETQVRKATTSDIYGVAKTKGVGGDSTGHKDIVSIYTI